MTPALAKLASETLNDVYVPDGCAVVIDKLAPRRGDYPWGGLCVRVTGGWQGEHFEEWFSLADLTASQELLRNAKKYGVEVTT